jgi:hypothetical protein
MERQFSVSSMGSAASGMSAASRWVIHMHVLLPGWPAAQCTTKLGSSFFLPRQSITCF